MKIGQSSGERGPGDGDVCGQEEKGLTARDPVTIWNPLLSPPTTTCNNRREEPESSSIAVTLRSADNTHDIEDGATAFVSLSNQEGANKSSPKDHQQQDGSQQEGGSGPNLQYDRPRGCCTTRMDSKGPSWWLPSVWGWFRLCLFWSILFIGVIAVPLAMTGWYVRTLLVHTSSWVSMTAPMATDPKILDAIIFTFATAVQKAIDSNPSAAKTVSEASGSTDPCPPCDQLSEEATDVLTDVLYSPSFPKAWRVANGLAHELFLAILTGSSPNEVIVTSEGGGTLILNLTSVATEVSAKLDERGYSNSSQLFNLVNWTIPLTNSTALESTQDTFFAALRAAEVLIVITVFVFVLALVLTPSRSRGFLQETLAVALGCALIGVICGVIYLTEWDFISSSLGTEASMRIQYWALRPLSRTAAVVYLVMAGFYLFACMTRLLLGHMIHRKRPEALPEEQEGSSLPQADSRGEYWQVVLLKSLSFIFLPGLLVIGGALVLLSPPSKQQFRTILWIVLGYVCLAILLFLVGWVPCHCCSSCVCCRRCRSDRKHKESGGSEMTTAGNSLMPQHQYVAAPSSSSLRENSYSRCAGASATTPTKDISLL